MTLLEHPPPSGSEGETTNADVAAVIAAVLESEQRIIAAIRGEMVEAMGRQSRLMAFSLVGALTANTVLVLAALRLGP